MPTSDNARTRPVHYDGSNPRPTNLHETSTAPAARSIPKSAHSLQNRNGDEFFNENSSTELGTVTVASKEEAEMLDCGTVLDATLVGRKLEGKYLSHKVPITSYAEGNPSFAPAPIVERVGSVVFETSPLSSFSGSNSLIFEEGEAITDTNHLKVPLNNKLWLVSPPGSPPIGWTSTLEHPPNSVAFSEDLMDALAEWDPDSLDLGEAFSSTSSIPRFPNTSFSFSKSCASLEKGDDGNHPLIVIEDWSA